MAAASTHSDVTYNGAVPTDHPVAQRLIANNNAHADRAALVPTYERHPAEGIFLWEQDAYPRLEADGLLWLAYIDPVPPVGPGQPASGGGMITAAHWQVQGKDPEPGTCFLAVYKTARRKRYRMTDGGMVSIPVWRYHRPDRPHKIACTDACAECGTGAYWDLPEFIWPEPSIGLADPDNPTRLHPREKMMWSLSGNKLPKVVYTPHARFANGATGAPAPVRRARIVRWTERDDRDCLVIRWNGKHRGESVVEPADVEYATDSTDPA